MLVYTIDPSIVEAARAGRAIVKKRLAASVNILPGMVSHYWWQGEIERGEEVVMIFKTRALLAEAAGAAMRDLHAHDTPAIVTVPVEGGDAGYLAWIMAETEGARPA